MPLYGDRKREYQRQWLSNRRLEWFSDKSCVDCGSTENLELDHVNPGDKVEHKIWSWSQVRRDIELAKCVARCEDCHLVKSRQEARRTIPASVIADMRRRHANGETPTQISLRHPYALSHICRIVKNTARVYG